MLAATHGVHSRVAVFVPCTSGVSALRNGHGSGSPSKSALRALGTSALVVPKPFLPAAVFLLFPGKALLCRERCSGHLCQKQRKTSWWSLDFPGVQKVVCLPGRDQASFPPHPEASWYWDTPGKAWSASQTPAGWNRCSILLLCSFPLQKSIKRLGI